MDGRTRGDETAEGDISATTGRSRDEDKSMSNQDSTTPKIEPTERGAAPGGGVSDGGTDEDTRGHVGILRIRDTGSDDDVEGNRLK